uniref:Uncharacterized protein n=1 Tax=Ananas comosus var. bracteatus TaxID=296719 RepID=A0A6V7Q392_ANACO|nr:unnamed protein product [Ananas comosus var. bracteatus]
MKCIEEESARAAVQILHWGRIALGDRSLAGRDRSSWLGWRGPLRQPVTGSKEPSRKSNSREPVSQARTGLPGTGLSGRDRFPNAKFPLPEREALGDRSPRSGTGPSLRNQPSEGCLIGRKLRG